MIIYKTYKFRMYPNDEQIKFFNKNFGSVRFIYNYFLNEKIKTYESCKKEVSPTLQVKSLFKLKETYSWLNDVDHCSLINTIYQLDDSFKKLIKDGKYPNFKSKFKRESYRITNEKKVFNNVYYNSIRLDFANKNIILPKVNRIPIRGYKNLKNIDGNIKYAVISKVADKFYVSILVQSNINIKQASFNKVLGIDVGIKTYVTTSDGVKYKNTVNINDLRLKGLYKSLSRSSRNSKNRAKIINKIQRFYLSLRNKRKFQMCYISNELLSNNDVIVIEDLDVKKMYKNHNIARKLGNIPISYLFDTINYKALWHGKKVIKVSRFFPSSQICNTCGYQNKEIKDLNIREWICPSCGTQHDRDINASINIRDEGLKLLKNI